MLAQTMQDISAGITVLHKRASGSRFTLIFTAVIVVLLGVMVAAFALVSPWSWLIGLTYIAYESWLTGCLFASSRRAVLSHPPLVLNVSQRLPTMAVLISARNEARVLPKTLSALEAQLSEKDSLIIIDDGSNDDTIAMLTSRYGLTWEGDRAQTSTPIHVQTVRQPNQGKARSLNTALALTDAEIVLTIDADTIPALDALAAFRATFAIQAHVGAACGVLQPHCQYGWSAWFFGLFQRIEYSRSYLWRMGWTRARTLVLVSGAFAAFRREALLAVGGFDPQSKVEDYELVFRLYRAAADRGERFTAVVIPAARAVTDAPGTVTRFLRQRVRWFAGFIETMFRHRDLVGDARLGRLGRVHLYIKTVDMILPLYGLLALVALMFFLVSGGEVHPAIVWVLVGKLCYDLVIHFWSMVIYRRWQGHGGVSVETTLVTILEPIVFQPLRQIGAALGWIAFLRGQIEWKAQRPSNKKT